MIVEAFAASWIEMSYVFGRWDRRVVEAFAASWIEIDIQGVLKPDGELSKPLRLRGLK